MFGTEVIITADAYDEDDDTLTYTWYINNNIQSQLDSDVYSVSYTLNPTVETAVIISCTVSDGEDEASANITITFTAPVTLFLNNSTGYVIDGVYIKPLPSGTWGNDLFSGTVGAYGTGYVYNVPEGTYDIEVDSGTVRYWSFTNITLEGGTTFTLNLL